MEGQKRGGRDAKTKIEEKVLSFPSKVWFTLYIYCHYVIT